MVSAEFSAQLASHYVLFTCEGTAEAVIISRLIDTGAIAVPRDRVVDDPMLFTPYTRLRKANDIAERFFRQSYVAYGVEGLLVCRVVDSRAGSFSFSRRWRGFCEVASLYTRPEIEMLNIHAEDAYDSWLRASRRNRALRPSEFCKGELGLRRVKEHEFLDAYWRKHDLVRAIRKYDANRSGKRDELSLGNLLM